MTADPSPSGTDRDHGLGHPVPQTADPIDRVIRLAPKWTLVVLIACGLLVVGTAIWAVKGTVTSSVSTVAVYNELGMLDATSTSAATVDQVLVHLGQRVSTGQKLITLDGGAALTSPQDGAVTSILVSPNSVLAAGTIAVRVTDLATLDNVVTLVPPALTGTVLVGQPVRMEVSSAPSSRYGYLLGTIGQISSEPYTPAQVGRVFGLDQQVVEAYMGTKPALLATIALDYDQATPSNYRWSVGQGPPFVIPEGMPITAHIVLSEQHPIKVVFP